VGVQVLGMLERQRAYCLRVFVNRVGIIATGFGDDVVAGLTMFVASGN